MSPLVACARVWNFANQWWGESPDGALPLLVAKSVAPLPSFGCYRDATTARNPQANAFLARNTRPITGRSHWEAGTNSTAIKSQIRNRLHCNAQRDQNPSLVHFRGCSWSSRLHGVADRNADEWYTCPETKEELIALLARHGLDEKAITAQAIALRSRELAKLEHMLASAELRRSAMFQEIARYRGLFSCRLRYEIERLDEEVSLAPPSDR
jgi:hypothetical protein